MRYSPEIENHSPDAARAIAATSVHERLMFTRGVPGARLLLLLPRGSLGTPPPRCRFSQPSFPPPLSPSQPPHRRSSSHVAAEFRRARTNSTWNPWRISCPRRFARRDKNRAIVLNPQGSPGRICTGLARCIVLGAPSRARDRLHAAMSRCGNSPLLSRTG